ALALSGCAQGDPLDSGSETGNEADDTIVVGSQSYYSNEIIAEIYAQALEHAGFTVERSFGIGQRELYIPSIEANEVDLFPEYTGNLLEYYADQANEQPQATETDAVYEELLTFIPEGLE